MYTDPMPNATATYLSPAKTRSILKKAGLPVRRESDYGVDGYQVVTIGVLPIGVDAQPAIDAIVAAGFVATQRDDTAVVVTVAS